MDLDEKIARKGFEKVLREDLSLKPNDIKINSPIFYVYTIIHLF